MTDRGQVSRRDYDALIGLGSNIGDKAGNITRAVALLCGKGDIRLVRMSSLYRSAPWGISEQDWFVNACAAVATHVAPLELLRRCLDVEESMGRVRQVKWGPRLIDVDVLTYGELTLDTTDLKLPHPFIEERPFVTVPLAEIAPDAVIRGRSAQALADAANKVELSRII